MHILSDGFVFHKSGNTILVKSISVQSPNKRKSKSNSKNKIESFPSFLLSRVQNGSCHVKNILKGTKKKLLLFCSIFFILFYFFFAGHKRSDLHHRHAIGSSACRKEKNRFFIELVFFFFTNNFFEKKALPFSPNQMGKLRGNQRGTSSPD